MQLLELEEALHHHNLGNIDKARELYIKSLSIKPDNADALHLLGVTFYQTGDFTQSIALIGKAIEINPINPAYFNNIGNSFVAIGKPENAITYYKQALSLKPDYQNTVNNIGAALHELGRYEEEISIYKNFLKNNSMDGHVLSELVKTMKNSCLLDEINPYITRLISIVRDSIKSGKNCPISPYHSLCLPLTLNEQLIIAQNHASKFKKLQNFTYNKNSTERIKVGYVSADFRDHPTAHLISALFKAHNRDKFIIYAYSTGRDDGSSFNKKIKDSADYFIDIADMTDNQAAQIINLDNIDILIDVMGYIQNARPGIFANRPARMQINFLAYPGTMGASFINYIITDKTVLPDEEQQYFSEKPLHMPNTYFSTNPHQEISRTPTREECNLPDDAFIFCCFNKTNKIDKEVFLSWMHILEATNNSVLWLLSDNNFTQNNIKQAAIKYKIDPTRIIFANRTSKERHLGRHKNADLFLDCFNICAHTTAIDSLYAGIPVITREGSNIISRASASILKAIGLEKLISSNTKSYEEMAIYYAKNPDKLLILKQQLQDNILSKPLFNITKYAENFEMILLEINNS